MTEINRYTQLEGTNERLDIVSQDSDGVDDVLSLSYDDARRLRDDLSRVLEDEDGIEIDL